MMVKMMKKLLHRLQEMDLPEEQQEEIKELQEAIEEQDPEKVPPRTLKRLKTMQGEN